MRKTRVMTESLIFEASDITAQSYPKRLQSSGLMASLSSISGKHLLLRMTTSFPPKLPWTYLVSQLCFHRPIVPGLLRRRHIGWYFCHILEQVLTEIGPCIVTQFLQVSWGPPSPSKGASHIQPSSNVLNDPANSSFASSCLSSYQG